MKKSSRKSTLSSSDYYSDIDAPVYIWNKIHETGNLSWLMIAKKKVTKNIVAVLKKAWNNIYDQYIKEFGFSESFISIKQKEIEIASLKLEFIATDDRSIITFIQIAEIELEEMKASEGKSSFINTKIAIEKHMKFQLNLKETSIKDFYSYLKNIN